MSSVLILTTTARRAGAEKIIQAILREAKGFSFQLGVLRDHQELAAWGVRQSPSLLEILFGQYDTIHTHLFLPGLIIRFRRIWDRKFRWIHNVHYVDYQGQRAGFLKKLVDRSVFNAADALVAVSPAVWERLRHYENCVEIDNAVDLHERAPSMAKRREPVLGTVAMLRSEKGIDDLLRAFAQLQKTWPRARLQIAGSGPELKSLQRLARQLGIDEQVDFLGYIEDLDSFYSSLDIYIRPSRSESYGLATIEAMQFGLPIVVADVGNLKAAVGDGQFGRFVPRDTGFIASMVVAIQEVWSARDEFEKRSRAGLRFFQSKLSLSAMVRNYEELYRRLLKPGICMIAPIVTHATGGLQRQLLVQTRNLTERGHQVFVLQRRDDSLFLNPELRAKWQHVRFLMPADFKIGRSLRGLLFIVLGLVKIWQMRTRIDVFHAHQLYSPSMLAVLGKWLTGKPVVVKVTASGQLGEVKQLGGLPFFRLRRWMFRFIDRVIVLTPAMRDEVLTLGFSGHKVEIIPNGVELPEIHDGIETEEFRILYVGRLSQEKSIETLIAAVQSLKGFRLHLDIVGGDDPERSSEKRLREQADAVPGMVTFHGHQASMQPFYARADVFVLPSLSEGLSNALLEAMAHGCVCLVSDIAPNLFVFGQPPAGLLFKVGDSADLAEQLRRLVEDRVSGGTLSLELRRLARMRISQKFAAPAIGEQLSDLYERVQQEGRA